MNNATSSSPYELLLQTARQAIEQYLQGDALNVPALDDSLNQTRGVFVTLWESPKKLRGCIGRTGSLSTASDETPPESKALQQRGCDLLNKMSEPRHSLATSAHTHARTHALV